MRVLSTAVASMTSVILSTKVWITFLRSAMAEKINVLRRRV